MKLISMKDFVLEQSADTTITTNKSFWICEQYAHFLNRPLTLGMFVPCDEDGEPMDEPKNYDKWLRKQTGVPYPIGKCEQYQQAKERVLFEGFEIDRELDEWGNVFFKDSLGRRWHKGNANMNHPIHKDRVVRDMITRFDSGHDENSIEDLIDCNLTLTPTALYDIGIK